MEIVQTSVPRGRAGRSPLRRSVAEMAAVALAVSLFASIGATQAATAGPLPTVSAGNEHACLLLPSAQVMCWGYNAYGQLGNGTKIGSNVPVKVKKLPPAASISAGEFHTCAIDQAQVAWCWGSNQFGALGNGTTTDSPVPVAIAGLSFQQIATGGSIYATTPVSHADFTCGVTTSTAVYCWGYGGDGQLGDGANSNSAVPVLVTGINASQVAAGADHACAVLVRGGVKCWGFNNHGELGNNTTTSSNKPVQPVGLTSNVLSVTAGVYHSCALLTGGQITCWGDNERGELGDGTHTDHLVPTPVPSIPSGASSVSAGGHRTCAIVGGASTVLDCWGDGANGGVGDGILAGHAVETPFAVLGLTASAAGAGTLPVQMDAGDNHSCVVVSTGNVECWGANEKGEIGDGTNYTRAIPTLVLGLVTGAQGISEGDAVGCAVTQTFGAACWGSVDGNDFVAHPTAQAVTALPNGVAQLAAGTADACALMATGSLQCWGQNGFGELGNGTTNPQPTPVGATGMGTKVQAVSEGDDGTCALQAVSSPFKADILCWGSNWAGQVGDGSTTDRYVPTDILLEGAQVSAAGFAHACAVDTAGGAWCWGNNHYGELGDGTHNNSNVPVHVHGLPTHAAQIAAGGAFNGGTDPGDFTCALGQNGNVYCWGYGSAGQLGNGQAADSKVPVQVGLSGPARAVVSGAYHACALLDAGSVQCWGDNNFGELGDGGSETTSSTPVNVTGLGAPAIAISANDSESTCALLATAPQSVWCWGVNGQDELGDGVNGGQSGTPQQVQGL